jgi:hypothetical protein
MTKRQSTTHSSVLQKRQKSDNITQWYHKQATVPTLQDGEVMFAKDLGRKGAKCFCVSTWAEMYGIISMGYSRQDYMPFYEPRMKDTPVMLAFDIDEKVDKKEDHNPNEYLNQFKEDLAKLGIHEDMVVLASCGEKNHKYKTSYHILVPGVYFESLKHAKAWMEERTYDHHEMRWCKCRTKKKNTAIYKVGNIEIDIAIYHKGWWRMPMCAKKGDTRVLELKGSEGNPLSLEQFKKLSIHQIPQTSRKIEQELKIIIKNVNPIRTRHLNSIRRVLCGDNEMSARQKTYCGLKGDFILDKTTTNEYGQVSDVYKAISPEWQCPNTTHVNNRCVAVSETGLRCFGCNMLWPHVDPASANSNWCDKTKAKIFDELRDPALFPYMGDTLPVEEDEKAPARTKFHWLKPDIKQLLANFFHSGQKDKDDKKIMLKLGTKTKQQILNGIEFVVQGKYQMHQAGKWLEFGKHFITIYGTNSNNFSRIKLPERLKRLLYGFLDIPFIDALEGKPHEHACDIEPHFDDDGTLIIGKHMPAIQFGNEDTLTKVGRARCPWLATFKKKTLAIELGCGGGKTFSVTEFLKTFTSISNQKIGSMWRVDTNLDRATGEKKVLAVVARKSLGQDLRRSLKELNFSYYEERDPSEDRLVCSVDSLQKFVIDENGFLRKYDYIILDESELTFSHFGAQTLKNSNGTFELLKKLVEVTPHVIFMSADISKTNRTDLFAKECNLDVQYIKSMAKTDVKSYYTLYKNDLLEYRILQAVKDKKKIVLYSNTAKFVKRVEMLLEKELDDAKICAIYNEPEHQFTEKKMQNMNEYEILLTSPSMAPGVSITEPFDVAFVYMLASEVTAGVLYMRQMTHRVRTITTGAVFVKFDTYNCPVLSEDIEDIRGELTRNKKMLNDESDVIQKSHGRWNNST